MGAKGWKAVVSEYCISRTPIAEASSPSCTKAFSTPSSTSASVSSSSRVASSPRVSHTQPRTTRATFDIFFQRSERLARSGSVPAKPLVELYEQVRANNKIRTAARLQDGAFRVRDSVLARAMDEIVPLAAQFQVSPDDLERGTAEMISCAAYCASAAQKPGKMRKIDFFVMHNVTCSMFLTVLVREPWIRIEDKVRLVEWKGRLDLVQSLSASERL